MNSESHDSRPVPRPAGSERPQAVSKGDQVRAIVIVLDSVGIGALPDAADYGDADSNTLGHVAQVTDLRLPNLAEMGLGNIAPLRGIPPARGVSKFEQSENPETPREVHPISRERPHVASKRGLACYGKMAEASRGKDTVIGHWELMGIITDRPFPTYPNGFPDELIAEFERRIGRKTIGNKAASGTAIIEELGEEHVRTGWPIVYTSADSVFQIAAHEQVIPVDQLYEMCRIARELLTYPHNVQRVIARPFINNPDYAGQDTSPDASGGFLTRSNQAETHEDASGGFLTRSNQAEVAAAPTPRYVRTGNRRDFSLSPPSDTLLDYIVRAGREVIAIGKIEDIFSGRGISHSNHTTNNADSIAAVIEAIRSGSGALILANLVDFDMLYGHRNDPAGYARALMDFDAALPQVISAMREADVLFITADHGCDPTTPSTDHSREYVPLLVYGKRIARGIDLGTRSCFADLAATISEMLHIPAWLPGTSFATQLIPPVI